jgi:hypothetical protein
MPIDRLIRQTLDDETPEKVASLLRGRHITPALFTAPVLEHAAELLYHVSLTAGFGDERVTMASRAARALDDARLLRDPHEPDRIADALTLLDKAIALGLCGTVLGDSMRDVLTGPRSAR